MTPHAPEEAKPEKQLITGALAVSDSAVAVSAARLETGDG